MFFQDLPDIIILSGLFVEKVRVNTKKRQVFSHTAFDNFLTLPVDIGFLSIHIIRKSRNFRKFEKSPLMKISNNAFTLIELLIVVAIIAILSAIAVPNFLNAQTRAKISRTIGDMRSIATAIESYHVDYHAYPPGYNPLSIFGLNVLTTPIAFLTSNRIVDPFSSPGLPESKRLLTYELVNNRGKIIEAGGGSYSVDPALPQVESVKGVAWWLAGRGPDKAFGFKTVNPEYDIRKRYFESDIDPEPFLDTVYDPTNGTGSIGNLYRAGGSPVNFAQRFMSCH